MDYELVKDELKKVKLEEFKYIDSIAKLSSEKILSEHEKLTICRNLKKYEIKINDMYKKLLEELKKVKQITVDNRKDIIFQINLGRSYVFSLFLNNRLKRTDLINLGINPSTFKYSLSIHDLLDGYKSPYILTSIFDIILNNQKLALDSVYIFYKYVDESDWCDGFTRNYDVFVSGMYRNIFDIFDNKKVPKNLMKEFENDKLIINTQKYEYVSLSEAEKIFEEELFNDYNKSLREFVIKTNDRISRLNYEKSPEYKEKILLNKINELYKKVKGEFIKQEILYSGNFLEILEEEYKLPNDKIVKKEKIIKSHGKNAVIVIARTTDNKYIITFQNRIQNKMIAEFTSGYIEDGEEIIEAAKRELKEETGYISDDLFVIDYAYTSPGIDNSITYIVIANACTKSDEKRVDGTELVDYGLFSDIELRYFINKDIMSGAMNKLAYYNFINNVEGIKGSEYENDTQKLCKRKRSKTYPYDYQK